MLFDVFMNLVRFHLGVINCFFTRLFNYGVNLFDIKTDKQQVVRKITDEWGVSSDGHRW
jgi:hypothetical protein